MKKYMTYSDKLKDPRWQKRRLEILNRDKWTCQTCGSTEKTLHVHHCYYLKGAMPWEHDDNCLKTLCEECHAVRQEYELSIQRQLSMYSSEELSSIYCDVFRFIAFHKMETLLKLISDHEK